MSNIIEYKDLVAFHPGYYIADIIADMGITQAEFATRLGTNTKTLSCLINGQANITNDLAKKLSVMMGTGEEVWLNLQCAYDQKLIEIQKEKDFDEQVSLVRLIDYKYFVENIGLSSTKDVKEKIANLCKFFKVSDLRIMLEPDYLINYRTGASDVKEKNIINSRAWVQTAINVSKRVETEQFNAEKLRSYLPEIRSMTVQAPDVFLPRIRQIFAECGVAFVLLPNLNNSGVNGTVKWINENRVLLAMNNRCMYADVFWLSLFHEIRHVLQKKTKTTFISCAETEMVEMNKQFEDDADNFAANYLISPTAFKKFSPNKNTSDDEIVAFANLIGIHPGIVVERLQREGIIEPNRCSKLKEKYVVELIHSA